jgi:hypothetical protein
MYDTVDHPYVEVAYSSALARTTDPVIYNEVHDESDILGFESIEKIILLDLHR